MNKQDPFAALDELRPENQPDLLESLDALRPRDEFQLGAEPPPPPQRNALEEFDRKREELRQRTAQRLASERAQREATPDVSVTLDNLRPQAVQLPPGLPRAATAEEQGFWDRATESFGRGMSVAEIDVYLPQIANNPTISLAERERLIKEWIGKKKAIEEQAPPRRDASIFDIFTKPTEAIPQAAEDVAGLAGPMAMSVLQGKIGAAGGAMAGGALAGPPGAATGAATGFAIGSGQYWYRQGYGSALSALVDNGVPLESANVAAATVAPFYAAIERLQFGRLLKYVPNLSDQARKALVAHADDVVARTAKKVATEALGPSAAKGAEVTGQIVGDTAVQVGQELAQEVLLQGSQDIAAVADALIGEGTVEGSDRDDFIRAATDVWEMSGSLALLSGASRGGGAALSRRQETQALKQLYQTLTPEGKTHLGIKADSSVGQAVRHLRKNKDKVDQFIEEVNLNTVVTDEEQDPDAVFTNEEKEQLRHEILQATDPQTGKRYTEEDAVEVLKLAGASAGGFEQAKAWLAGQAEYSGKIQQWEDARISFIRAEKEAPFEADLVNSQGNATGARVIVERAGKGTMATVIDKNNRPVRTINKGSYEEVLRQLQYDGDENGALIINDQNIELTGVAEEAAAAPVQAPEQKDPRQRRIQHWVDPETKEAVQVSPTTQGAAYQAQTAEVEGPEVGRDVSGARLLQQELGRARDTSDLQERRQIIADLRGRVERGDISQNLYDEAIARDMGPREDAMPELDMETVEAKRGAREREERLAREERQRQGIPEPKTRQGAEPTAQQRMEQVVGTPLYEDAETIDAGAGRQPRTYDDSEPSPEVVSVGDGLPQPDTPKATVKDTEVSRNRRASGHVGVVGTSVTDAETLGRAFEPLRNKASEWTYIVLRDKVSGEILSVDAHSFHLPGQAPGARDVANARRGDARFVEQMRQRIARLRGRANVSDVVIDVVHNHPGGKATASTNDLVSNEEFVELFDKIDGAEFGEHTIVDTGEATSIGRDNEWRQYDIYTNEDILTSEQVRTGDYDQGAMEAARARRREQDPLYGAYRRNEDMEALFTAFGGGRQRVVEYTNADIGQFLKNDQGKLALAVILDGSNNVRAALPFDVNMLKDQDQFKEWSRNRRAENGGRRLVVYYGSHDEEQQLDIGQFTALAEAGIKSGDVFDAVYVPRRDLDIRDAARESGELPSEAIDERPGRVTLREEADALEAQITDEIRQDPEYVPMDEPRREQNFQRWFGESKVTDRQGNPKVMYHGSPQAGFETFDIWGSKFGLFGQGSYFTENPERGSSYAESRRRRSGPRTPGVYGVYLSINNPLDMDAPADVNEWRAAFEDQMDWAEVQEELPAAREMHELTEDDDTTNAAIFLAIRTAMVRQSHQEGIPRYEAEEIIMGGMMGMGYDGVKHVGGRYTRAGQASGISHDVWIAWDPRQIKSATGNRGTFDPEDPSILREEVEDFDAEGPATMAPTTFDVSKIIPELVNEDGTLIPVYHGTDQVVKAGMDQWGDLKPPPAKGPKAGEGGFKKFRKHARGTWVTTNPKAASEYGMSAGNNAMDRMGGGESWDAEKVFGRPIKELEEEGIVEKSWRGYSWENPTAGRVAPLYANIKKVWRVPKDVEDDFYHRKSEGGRFPSQAASEKWAIEQAINAGADAIDHGGGTYQIVDPKILESAMSPGQKGGLYEDVTPLEADAKVSPQRRLFQSRARRFGSRKMGGIKRSEYFKTVAPQIRQIYIDKEMEDAPGTSQAQKRGQIDPRLKGNLNDGKIKQRMYEYLLEKGEQEDSDRYQDAIEVEAESWFLSGNRVPGIFTNLTPEQVLEIVRVEAGDELFTREVAERVSEQLKRMRPPREGEILLKTGHVETQLAHLIDRHDGKPPVDELRKVAGAPVKGKTKRTDGMFTRSIEDIKDRVIRGWQEMPGQYRWYNDFGAGAKSLVGDPNMIEFSGVFAITSAQQPPRGNLTDTLHLMATAREFFSQRHGYDGQSPLDVSGLDAEKTIEALTKYFVRKKIRPDGLKIFSNENQLSRIAKFYVTGVFDGGTKTGTYALNTFYRANSTFFPFTVNDVHVARGFGFVRKDIAKNKEGKRLRNEDGSVKYVENPMFATDDEYRYAQYVLSHVANDLGISPDQAQAAFWFYVKTHEAPSKDIDTDTGQGDGTYEDAAQFSQPEIDALTPLIDLGSPLTNRFTSESIRVDGSRGYQVSHAEVQELEELSRARGTRIAAALKPGKLGVTDVSFYTDDNRQPVPMSDLRDFYDDVERGIVNPETGKIKALELLGIDHDYEGIEGSWEGREPSMFIRLPYSDDRQAEFVASLFGDAFDQQAMAIDNPKLYSPEETDAIVGAERKKLVAGVVFTKEDGSAFTDEEMAAIDNAIDPKDIPDYGPYEGQHYSLLNGRRELKLLNFTKWTEEGEYDLAEAMRSAPQFIQDSSPKVIGAINARVQGKGYIFRSYLREAGAGMGPVGGEESSAGYARGLQEGRHYLRRRPDGPDVHQGLIDNLYGPYASSLRRFIDQRGWDTDLLTDERDPTTGPVRSTRLQQVFDTVDQPGDTAPDPEGRLTRLAEEVDDFETGAPAPPEFDTINYAPSEVLSSVRVQLDKRSLDRVVKSLQQTYEGQQVVADEAPFNARAAELGRDPTTLSGFVDQENNTIYINPAAAKADTPIHQFGHIWIQRLQEQDASLYNAGIELVRQSPYYERASKAGYGAFAEEEALVQLIGERGADIVEAEGATRRQQGLVQRILDRVGEIVQKLFGKRVGLDVTDMTLGDFVDVAARAVLENKPITTGQGVRGGDTNYRQRRSEQDRLSFGGKLFHEPVVETKAIAEEYVRESGIGRVVDRRITRVAAAQGKAIGDAYEAMAHSPERPEVMEAYQAMATETVAQYETILRHGYQVELWQGDGEPYVNSPAMMEDVRNNKHMFIFSTEEGYGEDAITDEERRINPLLADSGYKDVNGRRLLVNDVFRFVHDFFGHTKRGNGFGAIGEENAWDAHSQMYSDAARRAMTSETRGQNSWVNFGPHLRKPSGRLPLPGDPKYIKPPDRPFADQKNALLPDEIVFPERNRSRVLMEEVDDFEAGDVSGRARSIFNQIFGQDPPADAPPPTAPAPDVPPPAPEPAPGAEERRFPQSLERAGRVAPQDDSRYYIPQSNLETRRIVEQTFNKEGLAGLLRMVGDENQPPSAERTAAGIWLHAYYMDEANRKRGEGNNEEADAALERAVDVASTVSERLTRSGQEVQAASMIGLLSPESVGIYAQRRIDKINEKHGLGRKRIILKTKEKRTLTEKAYSRMKALALKAEALQQVGADAEALTSAMDDLVEQKTLTPEQVAQIDNFRNRYRQTLEGEPVDPADEGVRTKQEPQMGWRAILRNKVRTKAQGARERLREQGRLRAGIPVDEMADLVLVGVDKMAELGEGFRSWQQAMQSELAEDISAADMHKIYDQSLEAYKQDKKEARREFAQLKKIDEFIEKVAADPPLQDSRDVAELIEAIRTMKVANEDARVAIGQEVELMLKRLEPRAWTEYLTTILHIGRLLAPKTAGRNIIGNQLAWYAERAAMMTAATIDRGISAATGRDREIIYTPAQSNVFGARDFIRGVAASGSLVEGLKQATPELREGFRAGYRGISPRGLPTAADLPQGLTFDPLSEDIQRRGGVAQGAFQAARVLEGVMSAQLKGFDFAAYMRAYNTVLQEQAVIALRKEGVKFDDEAGRDAWISNWLSKTDPKIQKLADDYARYVTFQDDTVLANVGRFIKNLANLDRDFFGRIAGEDFAKRLPWKSMMFGEFLLAYPRVPANLINRGLAYSPAGILKSAIQFKRAAQEIETGSYREGVMALSRALVGSGGGALVWHLAKLGLMSGEEEEDWDIVDLKKQTTGEAKYRINVTGLLRYIEGGFNDAEAKKKKGDKLVSYDWAQPLAISAAFAINMQQAMDVRLRKDARRGVGGMASEGFRLAQAGARGAYSIIEEQPMLTGMKDLFKSYGKSDGLMDGMVRVLSNVPAGFVPQIVNQVRQVTDNTSRVAFVPDNPAQTAVNKLINRLPFVSETLPKMYKTLGAEMPKEIYAQGRNDIFSVFFSPAFVSEYNPDPVALMLLEPYETAGETGQIPRQQKARIAIGGIKINLTPEDRAQMQRVMAAHVTRNMERFRKTGVRYTESGKRVRAKRTPDEQLKAMKAIVELSGTAAKDWFILNRIDQYKGEDDEKATKVYAKQKREARKRKRALTK